MATIKQMQATLLVVFAIFGLVGNVNATVISSTFDSNNEGWKVSGDSTTVDSIYFANGGNPGGHIEAIDQTVGGTWYFVAPSKFLGNKSGALGQTLNFDLRQTGNGSQFDSQDIILNGGGIELVFNTSTNPLPLGAWVTYSVLLDEAAGWKNGGVSASRADIITVLGSLTRLSIRGEFISGPDTGSLDNVSINVVPVPAAFWLFFTSLSGLALTRKKLRS